MAHPFFYTMNMADMEMAAAFPEMLGMMGDEFVCKGAALRGIFGAVEETTGMGLGGRHRDASSYLLVSEASFSEASLQIGDIVEDKKGRRFRITSYGDAHGGQINLDLQAINSVKARE